MNLPLKKFCLYLICKFREESKEKARNVYIADLLYLQTSILYQSNANKPLKDLKSWSQLEAEINNPNTVDKRTGAEIEADIVRIFEGIEF